MKYQVTTHSSVEGLEEAVNSLIKEGWEPIGSIAVSEFYDSSIDKIFETYFQAMVKR